MKAPRFPFVHLSLLLSGMAGLVYETVWIRSLSFLTGSGIHALTATLAAYMGGMALGGLLLARRADRPGASPFRFLALLQLGTAAGAVAALLLQPLLFPVLGSLYRAVGPGNILTSCRFAAAMLLLGIPTVLMGATLPVAVRGVAAGEGVGRGAASLYAVNTAGGILGVMLAGFVLLPYAGYGAATAAATAASITAALLALLVPASRCNASRAGSPGGASAEDHGRPADLRPWLTAAFLAGFSMLAAEVLWTRALVAGAMNNSYAVATMLASVLCGIALGSRAAVRVRSGSVRIVFYLVALMSVWIAVTGTLLRVLPPWVDRLSAGMDLGRALALRFSLVFLVLMPASTASGMIFPLLASICSPGAEGASRRIGRLSAANTAGAMAGSILVTFLALPVAGARWSFACAAISCATSLLFLRFRSLPWRLAGFSTVALAITALTLAGGWTVPTPEGSRLLYHDDSPGGEITVFQDKDMPSTLVINVGGSQASTTTPEGRLKNRLMAYFPLLAHPDPQRVCVICFGTGITAGTAGMFPSVRSLDCVEINPSVIEAAGFFGAHNHDIMSSPDVRLVIEDARSHLAGTDRVYDVITEEPMHPGLAGVVSLYSREYYSLACDRLSPGGILSQWLPLYAMSGEDCRMVVATFLDVFPNSTLWLLGRDAMLIGRKGAPVDPMTVVGHLADPVVSEDLAPFGLDRPEVFLATYVMGPEALAAYSEGARIVTDDRPVLEYSVPFASYGPSTVAGNIERLMSCRTRPAGAADSLGSGFESAWEAMELFQRAECARDRFDLSLEYELLRSAADECPEFVLAGRRLAASLHQSAAILLERGDPEQAWRLMNMALATGHADALVLADLSGMETRLGRWEDALEHAKRALEEEPSSVAALRAFGYASLGSGDEEAARRALALADSLD